jgi:RHS repeat-associated protein
VRALVALTAWACGLEGGLEVRYEITRAVSLLRSALRIELEECGRANGADFTTGCVQLPNPPSKTSRGFTGQEEMDNLCLVNLNGRIYDPALGRMLSADPTVPDSTNGQAFDKYSYVVNNPLSFADPSGYSLCGSVEGTHGKNIPCDWDGMDSDLQGGYAEFQTCDLYCTGSNLGLNGVDELQIGDDALGFATGGTSPGALVGINGADGLVITPFFSSDVIAAENVVETQSEVDNISNATTPTNSSAQAQDQTPAGFEIVQQYPNPQDPAQMVSVFQAVNAEGQPVSGATYTFLENVQTISTWGNIIWNDQVQEGPEPTNSTGQMIDTLGPSGNFPPDTATGGFVNLQTFTMWNSAGQPSQLSTVNMQQVIIINGVTYNSEFELPPFFGE